MYRGWIGGNGQIAEARITRQFFLISLTLRCWIFDYINAPGGCTQMLLCIGAVIVTLLLVWWFIGILTQRDSAEFVVSRSWLIIIVVGLVGEQRCCNASMVIYKFIVKWNPQIYIHI